jgi:hypothetical protein
MKTLSKKLYLQAVREIYDDLVGGHSKGKKRDPDLMKQAENILKERLGDLRKMHADFEKRMRKSKISGHVDSLRDGHKKDLRRLLTASPGTKKGTAEEVVEKIVRKK